MDSTSKNNIIISTHNIRSRLMEAIKRGDIFEVEKLQSQIDKIFTVDSLDILKRIPGDKLRACKNIVLSHNTLYSYAAEEGGASPVQLHFMTEKYAIMIEHSETQEQVLTTHSRLLEEYTKLSNLAKKTPSNTISQKAVQFIEENFSYDITMEDIATNIHVHPSHLMKAFKKEMKITLGNFIIEKRLEEAKQLLIFSHLSITEIVYMVGFSNPQYFSRVFKNKIGITPKEYRQFNIIDDC